LNPWTAAVSLSEAVIREGPGYDWSRLCEEWALEGEWESLDAALVGMQLEAEVDCGQVHVHVHVHVHGYD
jgi:hypothetical protein